MSVELEKFKYLKMTKEVENYRKKDIEKIIRSMETDISTYKIRADKKKKLGNMMSKLDLLVSLCKCCYYFNF